MLKQMRKEAQSLEAYRPLVDGGLLEELYSLGTSLKGARVAHINATANGGGVAEILHSLIPMYRGLGIDASWLLIQGDDPFFQVTKRLHNALQGEQSHFTPADWQTYMHCNRRAAASLSDAYDVVFIHDPQPLPIRWFAGNGDTRWIWRCHIDMSEPDTAAWEYLATFVSEFDAAVFSISEFVRPGLQLPHIAIIPPAIDPNSPKNRRMGDQRAAAIVARFGVDPQRPFISQISRFDRWKDPVGVIECFKRLRKSNQGLQLALLGNFADDDPEGLIVYEEARAAAHDLPDVHFITGLTDMVNPFQSLSRVVIQKSVREGFGLTVSEALWKGTPVVAGNVGGIRLQIADGIGGFLVDSVEECADRVDYLLRHDEERLALGEAGREHVRLNFLLPRLLRDELNVVHHLLEGKSDSPRLLTPVATRMLDMAA